jgi:hypothetical protein
MKKLFTLVAILFAMVSNAQTFNGVNISGDLQTAIEKFNSKGFKVVEKANGNASMRGRLGSNDVELYIYTTPITKKVWKMVVYLEERESWIKLKSDYEKFVTLFNEKYGIHSSHYEMFIKPYYDGDGYELSAIQTEKANFCSFWFNTENMNINVAISKFKQLMIAYENDKLSDLYAEEKKKIDLNTF